MGKVPTPSYQHLKVPTLEDMFPEQTSKDPQVRAEAHRPIREDSEEEDLDDR